MIIEIDGQRFEPKNHKYIIIHLSDFDKKNLKNAPEENTCYGYFNDKAYSEEEARQMMKDLEKFARMK